MTRSELDDTICAAIGLDPLCCSVSDYQRITAERDADGR